MTNTPRRRRPQARLAKTRNSTAVKGSSSRVTPSGPLIIEYTDTSDMDDGQPLPPLFVDGVVWRVLRRLHGARTRWRRISLAEARAAGCCQVALNK